MKAEYGQVALVDGGGFFPESDAQMDAAWFLADAMKMLGTVAVGTSERELRWGLAYLKALVSQKNLPLVSANLVDPATRKPIFKPYVIEKIGRVKVGFSSVMSDKVDLGPARDSLKVEEPAAATTRTIQEMRKKGATVVVLLSQLGKVESEDLAAAVPGIDAVICGHNVPLLEKGRMVKNTVTSYGGEQGQFISRTTITLDARGQMTTGENESLLLGPEIPDKPEIAKVVKDFEDALNAKNRELEKKRIAELSQEQNQATDHFLGADLCMRCHSDEGKQWKTTAHSIAWQTLVDAKKDADGECIGCHVVGYKQPGGYQSGSDAPRLSNVQCENCHGMGTRHQEYSTALKISETTCKQCHRPDRDPEFDFAKKVPRIAHSNLSGETIEYMKHKPSTMLKSGSN